MSSPRKVKAIVTGINKFRDNITLFRFKPEFTVKFRSGQFLHLALDNYDPSYNWPESRVFSIANAPGKEFIDILVSPKGAFTNRMINEISIGTQIWLKLPYGIFDFNDSQGKDVVLIAGGTGISPFISFLENIFENKVDYRSINLYYGIRESDLVVFEKNIDKYKQNINGFHCRLFCENVNRSGSLRFEQGILPVKEIVTQTTHYSEPIYYLSGPKTMIESFANELNSNAISSDNIFFDKWE